MPECLKGQRHYCKGSVLLKEIHGDIFCQNALIRALSKHLSQQPEISKKIMLIHFQILNLLYRMWYSIEFLVQKFVQNHVRVDLT
jgi:hypothetical protein